MIAPLLLARAMARYSVRRLPQHHIVHVTGRCVNRCGHCFTREEVVDELTLEQLQNLARDAGPLLWLDIGGGEPFLRGDLPEIVAAFRADMVQIPTSGATPERVLDLTREVLRASPAHLTVSVSLDGDETLHDELRGTPGASAAAWETLRGLLGMDHPRLAVKVNTVLMAGNQGQVLKLMDCVREAGPDFHSVILHRGEPRDPAVGLPALDELRRMGHEILRRQARYSYGQGPLTAGMLRRYHRALWAMSLAMLESGRQPIPCLGGRVHLTVWSDGAVAPCEMLPAVGNVRETPLKEILRGERMNQARAGIKAGHCACTHNCAMMDSVMFSPRVLGRVLAGG